MIMLQQVEVEVPEEYKLNAKGLGHLNDFTCKRNSCLNAKQIPRDARDMLGENEITEHM